MDTVERDAGMLLLPRPARRSAGRAGYWLWLLVALVVVAVAHRMLGPSSSATTSTTDRALASSTVHACCWSRPTTTTRLPLDRDSAACSARRSQRSGILQWPIGQALGREPSSLRSKARQGSVTCGQAP